MCHKIIAYSKIRQSIPNLFKILLIFLNLCELFQFCYVLEINILYIFVIRFYITLEIFSNDQIKQSWFQG